MAEIKRRVKVFSYSDSNAWENIGTGFLSKNYIEVTQGEVLTITVWSELDNSIIIQSKVLPERSYKMQEGTMIIWTENDTCEIALSFQQKAACDELWLKICEVQGHLVQGNLSEDGDISDRFDDSWSVPELPPCELNKLDEILNLVTSVSPIYQRKAREGLILNIEKDGYISKLLDLFHICEDLDNMEGLHQLYEIFKALFMFNSVALLLIMLQDDLVMDVIGCLEYNPNKHTSHREYLAKSSQFKEVITFNSSDLLVKIHQLYKIQYIQQVILPAPSLFEENMMSTLNSFVLFNKTEIVKAIQDDRLFLLQLFRELIADSTPEPKYLQLVALLKELCVFSLVLENVDRAAFYLELDKYDFMTAVEGMLIYEDLVVVSAAIEILNLLAEFNSTILRDYALKMQSTANEDTHFLNIIISLLVDGEFTDIDLQLVNLIKALLNPENISVDPAASAAKGQEGVPIQQNVDKTLFLKFFYTHCMPRLLAPLMAQTSSDRISKDTSQNAVILSHILDILSLCVRTHTYHIRNYIIDKNVLSRALVLMLSSHGHLVLSAVRFCRRIIGLKDEFYNRYIIFKNLFSPVVKAFIANGRRYNLVNSAILELFDFIRRENVASLIGYIIEHFWSTLEVVDYVDTFKNLKLKQDQIKDSREAILNQSTSPVGNVVVQTRYKRDPRQMDEDEEAWFDEEDEEETSMRVSRSDPPPAEHTGLEKRILGKFYGSTTTSTTGKESGDTMYGPNSVAMATSSPDHLAFASYLSSRAAATNSVTSTTTAAATAPMTTNQGLGTVGAGTVGSCLQILKLLENRARATPSAVRTSTALQSLVDYDEDEDSDEEETVANTDVVHINIPFGVAPRRSKGSAGVAQSVSQGAGGMAASRREAELSSRGERTSADIGEEAKSSDSIDIGVKTSENFGMGANASSDSDPAQGFGKRVEVFDNVEGVKTSEILCKGAEASDSIGEGVKIPDSSSEGMRSVKEILDKERSRRSEVEEGGARNEGEGQPEGEGQSEIKTMLGPPAKQQRLS